MIQLLAGYSAIRWTGETTLIRTLDWVGKINRVIAHNRTTNAGYIGYARNDLFPSLITLVPGEDYLVNLSSPQLVNEAVLAPTGAFSAFPGYVPVMSTTPATPDQTSIPTPGAVNTATAAVNIIGGTLVARTEAGLVPYSTLDTSLRYLLFGFALNSALAGGAVQVQRNGYIVYPGLGLIPDRTLLAGANGRIVYASDGLTVHHVIGRSITEDTLSFFSGNTTFLL